MPHTCRASLVALACLLAPLPGTGQTLRDSHFANMAKPGGPCYARQYTAAHLAAHPDQQVTQIVLRPAHLTPEGATGEEILDLFVTRRGRAEPYHGTAYCAPRRDRFECLMEGDAGNFRLDAAGPARLRLTVGAQGMIFEGSTDVLELSATSGDDRVFLIPRAGPGECP